MVVLVSVYVGLLVTGLFGQESQSCAVSDHHTLTCRVQCGDYMLYRNKKLHQSSAACDLFNELTTVYLSLHQNKCKGV